MVTIIVHNTTCRIINLTDASIIKEIDSKLSYAVQGYQFMRVSNNWDGRHRLLNKNNTFPVGMLPAVKDILTKYNQPYKIQDERLDLVYGQPLKFGNDSNFSPRDYQKEVVLRAWDLGGGIVRMATGCHAAGTKILMYNGKLKSVEDIVIGDRVMGPDSKPRIVHKLYRGTDRMVKIIPAHGESFIINENHILSLKKTGGKSDGEIIDISFKDWEQRSKNFHRTHKLFRVPVEFRYSRTKEDPYVMGLTLGDPDMDLNTQYIPEEYKVTSRKNRLDLLAGIIDAIGHAYDNSFYLTIYSDSFADDIIFVARSLGFRAIKKIHSNNNYNYYSEVIISGEIDIIPVQLEDPLIIIGKRKINYLRSGFTYEDMGIGEYFGFGVDKDNRYLLGDFTVTHNSGKTATIGMLTGRFNVRTVIYVIGIELLYQMKDTLEWLYPDLKVGVVGDGHCDIQQVTIATIWSAASAFGKKVSILDSDTTQDSVSKNKKIDKAAVRQMVMEAEMFILDECQYAGSSTVQLLHRNSKSARHRFLFSGTPWRDSGDDILIESVGGPKFYDLDASKLIKRGYLVPPKIYFVNVPTMRGVGSSYHQVYKSFIEENKTRNDLIIKSAKSLHSQGRKILILVTKVSHGKHLLSLLKKDLRVSSLDGNNKTSDRIQSIEDMKNGNLDVLIASKIFDQGVDIPQLDALILAGSGKSSARALQRIGRVIRKYQGKKDAIVVDFFDNCKYLREHSQVRNKVYSTENEFRIIHQKR